MANQETLYCTPIARVDVNKLHNQYGLRVSDIFLTGHDDHDDDDDYDSGLLQILCFKTAKEWTGCNKIVSHSGHGSQFCKGDMEDLETEKTLKLRWHREDN